MISERRLSRLSITFDSSGLLVLVVISFLHYLNEEVGFTVLANILFILTRVQLSGTNGTKGDFNAHDVLNTKMNFQSQKGFSEIFEP